MIPAIVTISVSAAFGNNLAARRAQNLNKSMLLPRSSSRTRTPVIRNPDITKKASTPT